MINFRFLIIACLSIIFGCKYKTVHSSSKVSESVQNEKISYMVNKKKRTLEFNFSKIDKKGGNRQWRNIELESTFKIGGLENERFDSPSQIKLDREGNLYVLDNGYLCVKKFDKNGNFIEKFGREGSGPGEFRMVFDFDLQDDGTIAMVAPNLNKLVVFKDKNIFEFKPIDMALKVCFVSGNEVATMQFLDLINLAPITRINLKTEEKKEYENIIIPQNENADFFGYLTGDIHKLDENRLVYISSVFGYIIIFNKNGKILNTFKLINENKNSLNLTDRKRGVGFPRITDFLFRRSTVNNKKLYIVNNYELVENGRYTIDIYSLVSFKYKYSVELSNIGNIIFARFTEDKLYIIRDNTEIEVYTYTFS